MLVKCCKQLVDIPSHVNSELRRYPEMHIAASQKPGPADEHDVQNAVHAVHPTHSYYYQRQVGLYEDTKTDYFYPYLGQMLVSQLWSCCPAHWFVVVS